MNQVKLSMNEMKKKIKLYKYEMEKVDSKIRQMNSKLIVGCKGRVAM